ncbi:MAG: hypothetical protein ACR2NZ_10745 [Rubripirellula sp.]
MAGFFLALHWAAPLICLLINTFVVKRGLSWLPLFVTSCIVTYAALMLVVGSQLVNDAFARLDINASGVFGEGHSSDAGLALAPVLGVPVTLVWTAVNFAAFAAIAFCVRMIFPTNTQGAKAAEDTARTD